MAVVGGFEVDRTQQVELADDVGWFEGEDLLNGGEDGGIGGGAGAEGVDVDTDWLRMADGVGELDLAFRGQSGGDDVFSDPAAHVSGAAVDLAGVLTGEGAAAVTAHAAVGVDDDFPPGQTGIALGSADDEITGGVNEEFGGFGQHALRQDFFDDFLDAEFLDLGVGFAGGVLGGDDDVDDAGGFAIDVFHRDLGLGIGAKPWGFS